MLYLDLARISDLGCFLDGGHARGVVVVACVWMVDTFLLNLVLLGPENGWIGRRIHSKLDRLVELIHSVGMATQQPNQV